MAAMTRQEAFRYLKGKKTFILYPMQSIEIQKFLLKIGFRLPNVVVNDIFTEYIDCDIPYFLLGEDGCVSTMYESQGKSFREHDYELITPREILNIKVKNEEDAERGIKEEKGKHQLNFGEIVLVRDEDDRAWVPALFAYKDDYKDAPCVLFNGERYKQCIPYDGNEHLMGTYDNKEE